MTDRYERIRAALAMGPTPGPWVQDGDGVTADDEDVAVAMCCPSDAEAAYIAACEPDTIRELLAERDALAKDAAKYRWGINNARWVRGEQKAYVAIPVAPDTDLSCIAMRDAAIDAAMEGEK